MTDMIIAQPDNLYGPKYNYDRENTHVLPALLRNFHEAKQAGASDVVVWGSGTPFCEVVGVYDPADALMFLLKDYSGDAPLNVGSGAEVTIRELAGTVARVVGPDATLIFNADKSGGTLHKFLDSPGLHEMGWNKARGLEDGISQASALWLDNCGLAFR